jgi:uncharacterized membrane protein
MLTEFINLILIFSIYSFLGWLLEVTYFSFKNKKFTKRGFLFGPFCTIYGFSSILVLSASNVVNSLFQFKWLVSIIAASILSILLVTILEYITGLMLEKAFSIKLWDYSKKAFNLGGKICLQNSIMWGFMAFLLLTVIHPLVKNFLVLIPYNIKSVISTILILYFSVDMYLSARICYYY